MRKSDGMNNLRYYRSGDRCFRINEEWWVGTREGDQGPYPSREHAERELTRYTQMMAALEDHEKGLDREFEKVETCRGDPSIWLSQQDVI